MHVVFSTKDRQKFIDSAVASELYAYLSKVCQNLGCPVYQIGGIEDHVHILLELSRTVTISKLIETMKSNSSRMLKQRFSELSGFSWQRGYGIFSVDETTLEPVKLYIQNQKEHHARRSFKEELILLLNRSNIKYDERYLWD